MRFAWFAAGLAWAAIVGRTAVADDTELFLGTSGDDASECRQGEIASEAPSTFTPLAVPVDSFNRTRNMNDLFVGVFRPAAATRWPGNLKKYRLRAEDATIIDANDAPAVDPATGFFRRDSRSFWSAANDPEVDQGGAASRLPAPAVRNVYTHLDGNPADLTHASNAVVRANPAIDDALLGSGEPGGPTRDEVIEFVRGTVAGGSEPRSELGDPLHSAPAVMIYDGGR